MSRPPNSPSADTSPGWQYRVLAKFGIGSNSTQRDVLDAGFDMTADDRNDPVLTQAWETLRLTNARLLVDFLCQRATPAPDRERALEPGGRIPEAFLRELTEPCEVSLPDATAAPPPEFPHTPTGGPALWEDA
jgi:hypothetical protein